MQPCHPLGSLLQLCCKLKKAFSCSGLRRAFQPLEFKSKVWLIQSAQLSSYTKKIDTTCTTYAPGDKPSLGFAMIYAPLGIFYTY